MKEKNLKTCELALLRHTIGRELRLLVILQLPKSASTIFFGVCICQSSDLPFAKQIMRKQATFLDERLAVVCHKMVQNS